MKKLSLAIYLTLSFIAMATGRLYAQGEQKAIVFSGIVVDGKTTQTLPGARIVVVDAGRGTVTASDGSFSIKVFPGDSILFGYLGYKQQYYLVPRNNNSDVYSAIIALREDVIMLSAVTVYPFGTEEEFKKAFLAVTLPDQKDRDALAKSTDREYLTKMAALVPNNAQTNYRRTMDQLQFGRESAANKSFATTFSFLNPFAWASFIKSVKNGDLKPKEWRKDLNVSPIENIKKEDFQPSKEN